MAGHHGRHRPETFAVRVEMTPRLRAHYVRWWIERSGLTRTELREIATGVWADRVFEAEQRLARARRSDDRQIAPGPEGPGPGRDTMGTGSRRETSLLSH